MNDKVYRILIRFPPHTNTRPPLMSGTYDSESSALQNIPTFLNERKIAISDDEYIIHVVECEIQEVQTIVYVVDHRLPKSNPIAQLLAEG